MDTTPNLIPEAAPNLIPEVATNLISELDNAGPIKQRTISTGSYFSVTMQRQSIVAVNEKNVGREKKVIGNPLPLTNRRASLEERGNSATIQARIVRPIITAKATMADPKPRKPLLGTKPAPMKVHPQSQQQKHYDGSSSTVTNRCTILCTECNEIGHPAQLYSGMTSLRATNSPNRSCAPTVTVFATEREIVRKRRVHWNPWIDFAVKMTSDQSQIMCRYNCAKDAKGPNFRTDAFPASREPRNFIRSPAYSIATKNFASGIQSISFQLSQSILRFNDPGPPVNSSKILINSLS
ncbi:hypothetical protein Ddc_13916 [Ditylenchus destructor]|nr:hypothetical protein Ddc_13916 [Ditylenchus destructor]